MDKSKIYKKSKDEWYTPSSIVKYAAELVGGGFTLDPATTFKNAKRMGIKKGYTKWTDGLNRLWENETIWLNPPFSNKEAWVKKARDAVDNHNCKVILLLPLSLETELFRKYILNKAIIHIPNKRISFIDSNGVKQSGASFTSGLFELTKNNNNTYKTFNIKGDK